MSQSLHTLNTVFLVLVLSLFLGAALGAASSRRASAQEAPKESAQPNAAPAATSSPIIGWIEIEPVPGKADHVTITGKVYGLKPSEGRYTLEIKRHEKGNVSNSNQGGSFRVGQGETASLARSGINIPPASSLEIVLKFQADGREIFSVALKPGAQ
jgi:hypothetical protein